MLPRYNGNIDSTFFGQISGHVVPGSMFIIMGLWWLFNVIRDTLLDAVDRKDRSTSSYRSKVWYEVAANVRCRKISTYSVPFEPTMKILFGLVGSAVELTSAHWTLIDNETGDFESESMNNFSHSTMYGFFCVSGVVDILLYTGSLKGDRLLRMGHISLGLAFFVEGFLFYFHLSGHGELDTHAHSLLYSLCFLISFILLLEAFVTSPMLGLARCFCTILQGTWFYQVAFMLHGPRKWSQTSKAAPMFVPIAFSWHCLVLFVFLIVAIVIGQRLAISRCSRNDSDLSMECLLLRDEDQDDQRHDQE